MKRLLPLLLICSALSAVAMTGRSWSESQALTRAAPTLATEGLSLAGAMGYRVTVSAGAGQTITGGTAKCYFMPIITGRWARCPTALDLTPGTSVRDWSSSDFAVYVGMGRVLYASDSITLSAGTAVTIAVEARYY